MLPEVCTRSEIKRWVFEHVRPHFINQRLWVIRRIKQGDYYMGTGSADGKKWHPDMTYAYVYKFGSYYDALMQFPLAIWGSWWHIFLPEGVVEMLQYYLPTSNYEIVSVQYAHQIKAAEVQWNDFTT